MKSANLLRFSWTWNSYLWMKFTPLPTCPCIFRRSSRTEIWQFMHSVRKYHKSQTDAKLMWIYPFLPWRFTTPTRTTLASSETRDFPISLVSSLIYRTWQYKLIADKLKRQAHDEDEQAKNNRDDRTQSPRPKIKRVKKKKEIKHEQWQN